MNERRERSRLIALPDGRRVAVAITGAAEGRPLFIFHGLPGSRFQRPPSTAYLHERNLQLITMDRPGVGRSDPAPGRTLLDFTKDLAAIADQLGHERFSVIGVSGGGPYALACAAAIPERLVSIAAVASVAPPAIRAKTPLHPATMFFRLIAASPATGRLLLGVLKRLLQREGASPPGSLFSKADRAALMRPEVKRMLQRDFLEAFRPGLEGTLTDALIMGGSWGFSLRSITMPVKIIHTLSDSIIPITWSRAAVRQIPKGELIEVPGSGHYDLPLVRTGELLDLAL